MENARIYEIASFINLAYVAGQLVNCNKLKVSQLAFNI